MNSMTEIATVEFGDVKIMAPARTVARAVLSSILGDAAPVIALPVGIPRIGAEWPGQGGVNAGLMRGEPGLPDYYLIVPTHKDATFKGAYGTSGKVTGALSNLDGMANTRAMLEAGSEIAKRALETEIEGHRDFYITARHEARLCCLNVPEQFEKDWYWTSTQYEPGGDYAWFQNFGGGGQGDSRKSDLRLVRLVRRVVIR